MLKGALQLNGSGQKSRKKCHFEWNFQVCQNPPKLHKPTCVMWKDVPVLFFPKSREKRLDKQAWSSLPPSLIPAGKVLNLDTWDILTPCAGWQKTAKILLTSFGGTEGERGGGRLSCLCATFSYLLVGNKQHRNILSHNTGQLAKFGSILTYLSAPDPFNYRLTPSGSKAHTV